MKILCVTHSSRFFFEARCRLNALNQRFEKRVLDNLPPFESLQSVSQAVPYSGSLSLWKIIEKEDGKFDLLLLKVIEHGYRIQSACFFDNNLLLYGSDRIEVLDTTFSVIRTITDPWLVGGHTICPANDSDVWVTSAPANAVMRVNVSSGDIIERISIPNQYGEGYALNHESNLHDHYIPTDLQPCHVNAAFCANDKLYVTLWIQGAVITLEKNGDVHEVIKGLRGCHGGKPIAESNQLMVTDSSAGMVYFLDLNTKEIIRRLDLESRWVHDAERVCNGVVATTVGDRNELVLVDEYDGSSLCRKDCRQFGESVMFVNSYQVSDEWADIFDNLPSSDTGEQEQVFKLVGNNLLKEQFRQGLFRPASDGLMITPRVVSEMPIVGEFVLVGESVYLESGKYLFEGELSCTKGGVSFGLAEEESLNWVAQINFDEVQRNKHVSFEIGYPMYVKPVVAGNNPDTPTPIDVELCHAKLHKIGTKQSKFLGKNILQRLYSEGDWEASVAGLNTGLVLKTMKPLRFEYLVIRKAQSISPGRYLFDAKVTCKMGGVAVGIAVSGGGWLAQLVFGKQDNHQRIEFEIGEEVSIQLVVAAYNPHARSGVHALVEKLGLYKVQVDSDINEIQNSDSASDGAQFDKERNQCAD